MTRLAERLRALFRSESAGGLSLMAATVVALLVANSPLAVVQTALLDLPMVVKVGTFGIDKPLLLWINDGLMAVFFLLVGLELKREIVEGHLSSVRRAVLPAFAAIGGMVVPAAIYAACNWHDAESLRGWAIPAATDIAFALGVLSLLGSRVPVAIKALLLSIAIFDDLGAIVIIAVFHTSELSAVSLGVAGALVVVLAVLNRAGVTSLAALPDGVNWRQLHGMALLCGIGFTMSLFIASLAFQQGEVAELRLERIGIIVGSLASGLAGWVALRFAATKPAAAPLAVRSEAT